MSIVALKSSSLVINNESSENVFTLPGDLMRSIFKLLTIQDLCRCSLVSKKWSAFAQSTIYSKIGKELDFSAINQEEFKQRVADIIQQVNKGLIEDLNIKNFMVLYPSTTNIVAKQRTCIENVKKSFNKFLFIHRFITKNHDLLKKIINKISNYDVLNRCYDALYDRKLILELLDVLMKEKAAEELKEIYLEKGHLRSLIEEELKNHKLTCYIFLFKKILMVESEKAAESFE